jgi:hypothetical protein
VSEIASIACFDEVSFLGLVPHPPIIIGGTWLLREFLHMVAAEDGGLLSIAVPFIEEGLASDTSTWAQMNHSRIDVVIVAKRLEDSSKAWSDLSKFPWRSVMICHSANLHAKVYAFVSGNHLATCLVGSHNLTPSGLRTNVEAGVLFRSGDSDSVVFKSVVACHEYVTRLMHCSKVLIDTRKWPAGELETIGGRHE